MGVLRRLVRDESGQGLAEYGLIIALVAIGVIAGLTMFRDQLSSVFGKISGTLEAEVTD